MNTRLFNRYGVRCTTLVEELGHSALLVIDGGTPKSVNVIDIYLGVKLNSLHDNVAVVKVAGVPRTMRIGESPVSIKGRPGATDGGVIVLHAGSHGHFVSAVRLGSVNVYEVDAVVSSGGMPYVLLGNSFLARFQMVRTNDQMVLEKRY